jgi:predicted DNA repair protein MutK
VYRETTNAKKVVTMVTIVNQLLSRQEDGMVTTQTRGGHHGHHRELKEVGLHLDSTQAHFLHKNRGKCLKNVVARDGIEPPTPAFSGLRSTN